MKQGPFAPGGLCCPAHRHYYGPLRLPLGCRPLRGFAAYRPAHSLRRDGAEEGLPSSQDNLLTVPRPITPAGPSAPAPGSGVRSVAFALFLRARLLLGRPKAVNNDDAAGFTFVADRPVDPAPLRTRPLDHARGLHYRGPWRLPGPDFPQLAALSLSIGYVTMTSLSPWRPICWAHANMCSPLASG